MFGNLRNRVWSGAYEQPEHLNVNELELMPTAQTFAGLTVVKDL